MKSAVIGFLLAGFGTVAFAQAYRCGGSGGSPYYSDRPCSGAPTQIRSYGPMPVGRYVHGGSSSSLPKAPEHLQYLGSECASINDAIRTAPIRGIGHGVISELHDEYNRKCAEDDQRARSLLAQEQSRQSQARTQVQDQATRQLAQARAQSQQCESMRDVITLKRRREAALNPTEVAALRSLEAAFNQRCLGG